jgi:hypothetical protein
MTSPLAPEREPAAEEPRSRRDLLRATGTAAIVGVLGLFGIAAPAAAKDGSTIRAGWKTSATKPTALRSRKGPVLQVQHTGKGETAAVLGEVTSNEGKAIGVQGTAASKNGTAGQFAASAGGTALEATSGKKGVALRTKGRLELTERSGVASVTGGAEFVIPVSGGLDADSFVLATLQDRHPGIHVESASVLDAKEGLIVVRLNQALPEPSKVGWLVLD